VEQAAGPLEPGANIANLTDELDRAGQIRAAGARPQTRQQLLRTTPRCLADQPQPQLRMVAPRQRERLERQLGPLPAHERADHNDNRRCRRRPVRHQLHPRMHDPQPPAQPLPRIEVVRDKRRRDDHHPGATRRPADGGADQPPGYEIVMGDHEPPISGHSQARDRRAHSPRDHEVGIEIRAQPAELPRVIG
jgi:hypothetical protein